MGLKALKGAYSITVVPLVSSPPSRIERKEFKCKPRLWSVGIDSNFVRLRKR